MQIVLSIFLFLFCMLQAVPYADEPPVILILGDSLSAAYNKEVSESWPSLLQDRLDEHGHAYRVFNSSIAGDTTQGGLARLPRLLEKQQPAIVMIELGGNDGLRGIPLETTHGNLSAMIRASQQTGARVIISEMRIPPNYGRSYTEKFQSLFGELAAEYGETLLPFLLEDIALEPGMMQADGIHPSASAQTAMLDEVWAVLQPLLVE